jgi:hypothetical protein
MVTAQLPGLNISILRERTSVQRGQPVTISGRVSVLGFGVPAVVRVNLEGPTFDPQVTSFETMSSPTGDYAVAVIPDKDGQYTVMAQAFPFGANIPLVGTLLPPLAASPSPPLAVGQPVNGAVITEAGERVPVPPTSAIEIRTPIQVGAPIISIIQPAPPAPAPAPRAVPFPTAAAPAAPSPPPPTTLIIPFLPAAAEPEEGPPAVVGGQVVGFFLEQ